MDSLFWRAGHLCAAFFCGHGKPRAVAKKLEEFGQPLYEKAAERGLNKTLRMLVCGIPNVGKSAILNRMIGEKRLKEGNKPG